MRNIDLTADQLASSLLGLGSGHRAFILDSCGVRHLGSRLMIAGLDPVEIIELPGPDADRALADLDGLLKKGLPVIFTLGYELGLALNDIQTKHSAKEPFVYAAAFDSIAVHDYVTGETVLAGAPSAVESLKSLVEKKEYRPDSVTSAYDLSSDLNENDYLKAILAVQERIRAGDTYQTNLTRKVSAELPDSLTSGQVFRRLRRNHPAPFAAYLERPDSTVISASPERFFRIKNGTIATSPIKGTRPRGANPAEDVMLRDQLLNSPKDRAENIMIVDLLRNDLGRVCEFGSVRVESLCDLEEHPSLYHMVSTIKGELRPGTSFSDVIRAIFPCGSITGAPKISTMRIIDEIERSARGLSMGAIGIYMPASLGFGEFIDSSVAIRTMTVRGRTAEFSVGGGIVIDSDPSAEYQESVTKSLALLSALGL